MLPRLQITTHSTKPGVSSRAVRPSRKAFLPLITAGLFAVAASSGFAQLNVTIRSGVNTTNVTGSTLATFDEVSTTNTSTTYTSPTSLSNAGRNGTFTISGLTAGTQATPGSFVNAAISGQVGTVSSSGTYLAVGPTYRPGPLTFAFSNAANNYFGLYWASPDSYNSLTITYKTGNTTSTATYTPGTTNGGFNLAASANDSYVDFLASAGTTITGVSITSSSAAFEFDNVAFGTVPEPATWLGAALLASGAVWTIRRRFSGQVPA